MILKNYLIVFLFIVTLVSCVANNFTPGFFPNTELITVTSSSNTSLRWVNSFRDIEVILLVTTKEIRLTGNQIDSSIFVDGIDTKYWRLTFGIGTNGNINPTTDLSSSISNYIASAGLPAGGPYNWIVWGYDQNGNLIRSSLVYSFP